MPEAAVFTSEDPEDGALTSKKTKRRGAPSKRNPAVIKRGLAVAKEGLPLRFVAGAMGITIETLCQWKKDPEFAQALESARTEGVLLKFRKILEVGHGKGDAPPKWEALAWALERAYCAEFSRPEIQLHSLNMQVNQTNNQIIISAEQASNLRSRNKLIDEELDELAKSHEVKQKQLNGSRSNAMLGSRSGEVRSNGSSRVREIEAQSSLVPKTDAIQLPSEARRTASWWKMLSGSPGERGIALEAAKYAFKTVATDCVGAARASGLSVDWGSELPRLSDLWNAISEICGEAGWAALVKRGAVKRGVLSPEV